MLNGQCRKLKECGAYSGKQNPRKRGKVKIQLKEQRSGRKSRLLPFLWKQHESIILVVTEWLVEQLKDRQGDYQGFAEIILDIKCNESSSAERLAVLSKYQIIPSWDRNRPKHPRILETREPVPRPQYDVYSHSCKHSTAKCSPKA